MTANNMDFKIEIKIENTSDTELEDIYYESSLKIEPNQVIKSENVSSDEQNESLSMMTPKNEELDLHTALDIKSEVVTDYTCTKDEYEDTRPLDNNHKILINYKTHKDNSQKILIESKKITHEYKCKTCFKYFRSELRLLAHLEKSKTLLGTYRCKKIRHKGTYCCDIGDCVKVFTLNQHLTRHKKSHYTCKYCKVLFSSTSDLDNHLEIHKIFQCQFCVAKFLTYGHLNVHCKSVHSRGKTFSCTICEARFSSRSNVVVHTKAVHQNIRPYICTVCEKRFTTSSKLKNHQSLHSDQRDFECGHCHKRFKNGNSLNSHIDNMHVPARMIYECHICERMFKNKRHLRRHENIHLDKELRTKRFCCDICMKWFEYKQSIINHLKVHAGEQPYECSLCGRHFSLRSNMLAHRSRVHNDMNNAGSGFAVYV